MLEESFVVGPLTSWLVSFVEWAGNSTEYRFGTRPPNFCQMGVYKAERLGSCLCTMLTGSRCSAWFCQQLFRFFPYAPPAQPRPEICIGTPTVPIRPALCFQTLTRRKFQSDSLCRPMYVFLYVQLAS